jgi:hypothetical protein
LRAYDSTIALRSSDNPDSLRGAGLDFVVLDEAATMDPVTWTEVLRPALADRRGEALFLGTPRGYNHFYDWYTLSLTAEGWSGFRYTTQEGGLVDEAEVEMVRRGLDPATFAQEFLADFSQSTNRVFLMFDRTRNVRSDVQDLGGELWCGIDFNVNPLSCIIATKAADELHVFNELALHNASTIDLAEALKKQYPTRPIVVYPDPTGRARKTSAPVGQTDFTILQQAGFRLVAPREPYAQADKINTLNSMFCTADGRRRIFVHPRCSHLIKSLEQLPYRPGTSIVDKSLGLDHFPDALAYLVLAEFPLVAPQKMFAPAAVAKMFTGTVQPLEESEENHDAEQ